ncbi:unnamed protein product [Angiostrongylus costaricensis]|uniref:Uncharacterized protein n=1 Tax=Angiostrongylus costaricensis TaxID=334426 RepID=A0A0R3PV45_ANGCS|nr:unnamed protein product [Angiostrongylus costaricensis]
MCKMCDRYVSCANEISEQCPPYTSCYTIKSNGVGQHIDCQGLKKNAADGKNHSRIDNFLDNTAKIRHAILTIYCLKI